MIKLAKKELEEKYQYYKSYTKNLGNNATMSEVDPNANVTNKNVATFGSEFNKDIQVQENRYILGKYIEEMFSSEDMKEYYRQLEDHEIYSHDESGVIKPYCVAIDLYPFINYGSIPVGGNSKAPEHLLSFCGSYVNLMFIIAGQFNGAVADVSLLTYFDYFARKDYGDNYLETNKREIKAGLKTIVYTLNDPAGSRGFQSIFYNTSIFDEDYFNAMFGELVFPDFTHPNWESVKKLQKFFMSWFNQERTRSLLTFPVMTAAFLTEADPVTGEQVPKDKDFEDFIAKEMSEGNSFFIYSSDSPDSLSSCCRLKNTITEKNTFAYTLGGTGVATGSEKVFSININRLVQTGKDLNEEIKKIHKYLVGYNQILVDNVKAKMMPVYDAGFISLDSQYLTIGVNGVLEAAEFLGYEISDNDDYKNWLKSILKVISDCNKEESELYSKKLSRKIMFNTEFVPAENLGVKFAKWDKKDGLKVSRDCYNSYFYIVESDKLDIFDKFNLYSRDVLQYLDGGSAYHMNLSNLITDKETWKQIIRYSTKVGCNYWTYNTRSTYCPHCNYINKETVDRCIKCGSTDVKYATRVIGYLKLIENFAEPKQIEAGMRFYHNKRGN